MSGTCKDCKWWEQNEKGYYWFHRSTAEVLAEAKVEARTCQNHTKIRSNVLPEKPDHAAVIDAEYYAAMLITGPDFGCVHFDAG